MEEHKKEFTGVWIPRAIVEDTDLTWLQRAIYAEISCYKECFATNRHISKVTGCSERYVSEAIQLLKEKGYIVQTRFDGRKRYLKAVYDNFSSQGRTTVLGSIEPQFHADTNPSSTIDNTIDKTLNNNLIDAHTLQKNKREGAAFVPPTMEELLQYLDELRAEDPTGTVGGLIDRHLFEPYNFMGYYETNGWMVGKNKMKSWKGAVRSWVGREKAKLDREVFEYNNSVRESLGLDS